MGTYGSISVSLLSSCWDCSKAKWLSDARGARTRQPGNTCTRLDGRNERTRISTMGTSSSSRPLNKPVGRNPVGIASDAKVRSGCRAGHADTKIPRKLQNS